MGCTPSKSNVTYTHERVCRDLDTCSTFVPSVKSSVSISERPSPRLRVETGSGTPTFLRVACGDRQGRAFSQPNSPGTWSTASTASPLHQARSAVKCACSDSDSDDSEAPACKR